MGQLQGLGHSTPLPVPQDQTRDSPGSHLGPGLPGAESQHSADLAPSSPGVWDKAAACLTGRTGLRTVLGPKPNCPLLRGCDIPL